MLGLFLAGVVLRLAFGLSRGEDALLRDGYEFYVTLSTNFLQGHGFCYAADGGCAARVPLYPLWLSPFLAAGLVYPWLIVAQSVVGAALVWIAWELGTLLFDRRVGLMAAAGAAFSPYAVLHDTALQDTVFVNVLMMAALWLLLRGQRNQSASAWIGGGVALALAVLANARIVAFVPCALAWVALAGGPDRRIRLRAAAIVLLPVVLLLGGWMGRNWRVVGSPVLTTEAGERLWYANNPWTFSHFPVRSIDLTAGELAQMPAEEREQIDSFRGSEVEQDRMIAGKALDYMTADPGRTAVFAMRKLWVAASAQLSPARSWIVQLGYAGLFLPVHLLALVGLWRSRADWRPHSLTWVLMLAFAVTTALFWAHTSHKSYLDPVLFVYAAAGALALPPGRFAFQGAAS